MKVLEDFCFGHTQSVLKIVLNILLLSASAQIIAQEPPPRPVVVTPTAKILSFGAFYQGLAGGTVTITPGDTRSATGDVVLLGMGYSFSSARFEIIANPGTVISVLNGPDAILSGVPSGTMTLQIGASDPVSPFVTTVPYGVITYLNVGGILIVGAPAANPPGNYSGTFQITLVQE